MNQIESGGMNEFTDLMVAFFVGMASGFLSSIPVGPINVTILHEGMQRGFRWALLIGLGAVVMETIYCAISFAGFSGLFESRLMRAAMELISFVLLLYLGIKFLRAKKLPEASTSAVRIEEKLHPHTAFMIGFVRVLGNPAVLLFWITLSAALISHEWVDPTWAGKLACVGGVAAGTLGWFSILAFAVSRGYGRMSDATLVRLSHWSGVILLVFTFVIGHRLVQLLATR
jgi:threonine/homoserine/homoserine lactone efflux protein